MPPILRLCIMLRYLRRRLPNAPAFHLRRTANVQATLGKKLGVDFQKYRILGACNPPYAYEALQKEGKIGTMLPCNVIVQEISSGEVEVDAIDPVASMQAVANPGLADVALAVQQKLRNVVVSLDNV